MTENSSDSYQWKTAKIMLNVVNSACPLILLFYLTFNIYEKYKKKIKIKKSDIIQYVIIIVVFSVFIIIHCYINMEYIMHYVLSIIVTIPMAIVYFHNKIASIVVEIIWLVVVFIFVKLFNTESLKYQQSDYRSGNIILSIISLNEFKEDFDNVPRYHDVSILGLQLPSEYLKRDIEPLNKEYLDKWILPEINLKMQGSQTGIRVSYEPRPFKKYIKRLIPILSDHGYSVNESKKIIQRILKRYNEQTIDLTREDTLDLETFDSPLNKNKTRIRIKPIKSKKYDEQEQPSIHLWPETSTSKKSGIPIMTGKKFYQAELQIENSQITLATKLEIIMVWSHEEYEKMKRCVEGLVERIVEEFDFSDLDYEKIVEQLESSFPDNEERTSSWDRVIPFEDKGIWSNGLVNISINFGERFTQTYNPPKYFEDKPGTSELYVEISLDAPLNVKWNLKDTKHLQFR